VAKGDVVNEGIMVDHEDAVPGSSHVELDAVDAEANRLTKGPQRVLSLTKVRPSMGEDQGHA
jgi:hypothetical protein